MTDPESCPFEPTGSYIPDQRHPSKEEMAWEAKRGRIRPAAPKKARRPFQQGCTTEKDRRMAQAMLNYEASRMRQ